MTIPDHARSSPVRVAGALGLVVTLGAVVAVATLLSPGPVVPVKTYSQVRGDGLPPKSPNPWFFAERAFPLGAIPRERWRLAQAQASALKMVEGPRSASWTQRGPTNIGGRITCIAVHPFDGNIVYAGAAEGGVLRSVDGGQSWTPLFDDQPVLSIGAVAIDPGNPDVIYAGTGEVNPGGGSVAYGGAGLFRSIDQGDTWEFIGLPDSGSIGRIRIDPTDSNRIFVAVMGFLWETNPERGVYRTTDGGTVWEQVLFVDSRTGCVDLIMRPDDPDVLYAAMWQRLRQSEFFDYGGPGCAVYRTTNGGDAWALVSGGLPAPGPDGGRIGVSLAASNPDVMHAIYADRTGFFDGLFRSADGGFTWSRTNDGGLANVYSSFGWWFGNVRTHPADPDTIYVLGLPFFRSTNGGASWQNASGDMHVDHHGLGFGPGPEHILYEGNDGGVYRSANGGSIWTKLFDLPVTQAYRIALDANNANALYLGAQDNGTNRTQTGAVDDWIGIFGGDGFQPLVHPNDSNLIWAQSQFGNLAHSGNGGASFSGATSGISAADRKNWNSPLVQDPTDPDTRYFGTNKVYRSTGNTSWTAISPNLTGGPHAGNAGQVFGTLTTLAVSPLDGSILWAGSDDGFVHVTTDGGANWTDVSAALPVRWVTSVGTDPFSASTAYVTISGFRWAEALPRVFRTTDLGANWEAITGNLPDAPVNGLVADPDNPGRSFVATDLGVYETLNGGISWSALGTGLPNVVATSLALDQPNRVLYAGTYGRSVFSISIATDPCPWDCDGSGDGLVGIVDFLALLGQWGQVGSSCDFNGGGVGIVEFLDLLGNWGRCP